MKLLVALFSLTFTSLTFACTDFSGKYLDDDLNPYTITQEGCESVKIGHETLITDETDRLKVETPSIKITTAASHIEYYLQVENILEYKNTFPEDMPLELIPFKYVTIYTYGWQGNLAIDTTVYNKNGEVISSENTIHQKL